MKKRMFGFIAVVFLMALIGCVSSGSKTTVMNASSMPPWFDEQPPAGMLWGIGVADNAQIQMRLKVADARAKTDITRQLNTLVQDMLVDYARDAGSIDSPTALQFQESVTRQISRANLQGAVKDVSWISPDGKTYWVRVKISKADAARAASDSISTAVDSEAARYAEFKAMDAIKMLETQLDKNSTAPNPVRN
jgi:hypothetical protein